jgi:hypothetical protein
MDIDDKKYGAEHTIRRSFMKGAKKVDAHEYTTEAKDMPIEACQNLWIITYGDDWLDSTLCAEQEQFMWEVGNRLYWADLLEHDLSMDKYRCKS